MYTSRSLVLGAAERREFFFFQQIQNSHERQNALLLEAESHSWITSCALTLAVQHGLGLEVDLRRVRFGRTRAQGVGRERDRIGGHLAGLSEGLCAAKHLLSLRLCDRLGHGVGRLLRWRLGYGLGHGSCALQRRHKSYDAVIKRNWVDDYQTQKTTKKKKNFLEHCKSISIPVKHLLCNNTYQDIFYDLVPIIYVSGWRVARAEKLI